MYTPITTYFSVCLAAHEMFLTTAEYSSLLHGITFSPSFGNLTAVVGSFSVDSGNTKISADFVSLDKMISM